MKFRALPLVIAVLLDLAAAPSIAIESDSTAQPIADAAAQPANSLTQPASATLGLVKWAGEKSQELMATSLSLLGVRYRLGASDPALGFDCSGFVQHVYKQALGLLLPHNAYSMSLQGKTVGVNELQPGDLVFFNTVRRQFSHVGIYIGENRFIHAPSHGKGVQVDDMNDLYWGRRFNGARRLDTDAESLPQAAP